MSDSIVFPHRVCEWPCDRNPRRGTIVDRMTWNGIDLGYLNSSTVGPVRCLN